MAFFGFDPVRPLRRHQFFSVRGTATIQIGDARTMLRTLPTGSHHCCVTSPPYFGQRDYGVADQIGLEKSSAQYVAELLAIFREVKRVLRDDGTLWLNLGDGYKQQNDTTPGGIKHKDMFGIPWTVAFALRDDGWYLRRDIIWSKSKVMPESVRDRPTTAHEYIFLLSKQPSYFFDADAVAEVAATPGIIESGGSNGSVARAAARGHEPNGGEAVGATRLHGEMRNIRSVWALPPQSFAGAHFATFPEALVVPCVKAGTSEFGCCPHCGAPCRRVVMRGATDYARLRLGGRDFNRRDHKPGSFGNIRNENGQVAHMRRATAMTVDWEPTCGHTEFTPTPCHVLDPFGGAGTTGLVAGKLGRHSTMIEINPEYAAIANARLTGEGVSVRLSDVPQPRKRIGAAT